MQGVNARALRTVSHLVEARGLRSQCRTGCDAPYAHPRGGRWPLPHSSAAEAGDPPYNIPKAQMHPVLAQIRRLV